RGAGRGDRGRDGGGRGPSRGRGGRGPSVTPSPRLVHVLLCVAAIATLPALFSDRFVVVWEAALAAAVFAPALDVALAPTRRGVEADVETPRSIVLGDRGAMRVRIASGGPVRVRLESVSDLDERFEALPSATVDVPARGEVTVERSLVPMRRGALSV